MLDTARNKLFTSFFQSFRRSSYKLVSSKDGKEEVYYKENGSLVVFVGEQFQEKIYDAVTSLKNNGGIETKKFSFQITKYYANDKRQVLAFKARIEWKDENKEKSWKDRTKLERLTVLVSFVEAMIADGYYLQEERFENETCTQICAFLSLFTKSGYCENTSKGCLIKYVHYVLSNGGDLEEDYKKISEGKVFWKENEFPYKLPIVNMCYAYFKEKEVPFLRIWRVLEQEENLDEDYEIINQESLAKESYIIASNDLYTVYEGNVYDGNIKIYHNMPNGLAEFLTYKQFKFYTEELVESVRTIVVNLKGEVIGYRFYEPEEVTKFNFEDGRDVPNIIKTCTNIQSYLLQLQNRLNVWLHFLEGRYLSWRNIGQEFCIEESFAFSVGMSAYKIKDIWSLCALRETDEQEIKKQIVQIAFKWYIAYLKKKYGNLESKEAFLEKDEVRYMNPNMANELICFALNEKVDYEKAVQAFRVFVDNLTVYKGVCVDTRYVYNSEIAPFLFDYEFDKKYGIHVKNGMSEKLPNGQIVTIFKKKKNLSHVVKKIAQAYDNFEHTIAKQDKQLKLVGISEYIYSSSINSEGMHSVIGYITEPIAGKKLTTELLLSLNNIELYEVISILFSKFTNYWIQKADDIWLDGGHSIDEEANTIYINVLSDSFTIEKWKRPESFMEVLIDYLMKIGYNPNAFYLVKEFYSKNPVAWKEIDWNYFIGRYSIYRYYCKQHGIYYHSHLCPICRKNRIDDEKVQLYNEIREDETARYCRIGWYASLVYEEKNIKVYKNPALIPDTIKQNIENMVEARIKMEVLEWIRTTSKTDENERTNMFGQEEFIPKAVVLNGKNEVIGYAYQEEEIADETSNKAMVDLQDTKNLSNRARLMALVRLMTQVKSLVEQGKGFIQNPFGHVFLAKEYKKQVQILNIEYLSTQGDAEDTLKWTYEYVCKTIALDSTIQAEELYQQDAKYSTEQYDSLLNNMQNLAKRLTKYCTIHRIYYGDRALCPQCIDEKALANMYMEEVNKDKITSQKPVGEGGESIIYPYGQDKVAKVFRDDKVDKNFKVIVLSRVMKKKAVLERANAEKRKYHYVIPQKFLLDSSSREFFAYVMEKVQGMPISNLKDKKEIERLGFTMQDTFEILITIGEGIENLHKNGIYIGDLNGRNILFDTKKNVYFLEFDGMGIDDLAPVFCTDGYIDPISKKNNHITMKDDWYSFAIQAFYYLTLTHPFNGIYYIQENGQEVMLNIPEKMERKISLLGKHGMEVPAVARSWDWMSNSLKNAFLNIFEKESRESIVPKLVQEYNRMYGKSIQTDVVEVAREMVKQRKKKENENVVRINPKFIATKIGPFSGVEIERVINESVAIIRRNREDFTIELMVLGHKLVVERAKEQSDIKNVLILQDAPIAIVIYEEKDTSSHAEEYARIIAYHLNTSQMIYEEDFPIPLILYSKTRYEVVNGNTLYFLTDNEVIEKRTFMPDGQVKKEQIEFLTSKRTMGFFVQDNSKFVIIKEGEQGKDEIYCNAQKFCEIDGSLPERKYHISYDAASHTWLIINSEGNAIIIKSNGEYFKFNIAQTEEWKVENIQYQKRILYIPQKEKVTILRTKKDQITAKEMECHKIMTPQTRLYNINQEGFRMITDNTFYEVRKG